jgi:hypothetical protein
MSENVLVIPATFMVGNEFPANLPLADGSMKPIAECTVEEVRQAVGEIRAVARASRERLRRAYEEHVQDLELLAQISAYEHRYDEWAGIRTGSRTSELLWSLPREEHERLSLE